MYVSLLIPNLISWCNTKTAKWVGVRYEKDGHWFEPLLISESHFGSIKL